MSDEAEGNEVKEKDIFGELFAKEIGKVNPEKAKRAKKSYRGEEERLNEDLTAGPKPGSMVDTKR